MTTDPEHGEPRGKLAARLQWVLTGLETVVYGIACLLLVVAAGFVLIGTGAAILHAIGSGESAIESSILVLDRILLALIVAELAYTLRVVIERHEIAAEPFLFIGVIAAVRRILIVTAEFEQPQTETQLFNLLFELGMLGVLVLALAAAIFLIRYSSAKTAATKTASVHPEP